MSVPGGPRGRGSTFETLVDFPSDSAADWTSVDDDVMGGRSSGRLTDGDGSAVFEGTLSLENGGGFASVRTRLAEETFDGVSRVRLRVRGDGRRYELRLGSRHRADRVSFGAAFATTPGRWITVDLPLADFEPTFRGRRPPDAPPLDPSRIGRIGFMLTDGREGPFRLEIDWIGVARGGHAG